MIRPIRWVLAAIAVLALLAGCTSGAEPVTRSTADPDPTASSPADTSTASSDDLAARKAEVGIAACPASDPSVPALPDGLPDVTLPCLGGGQEVRLSGLRGTPLVVNVWAQWCPPCRKEAPHLAEVSQKYEGKVAFLGVDYIDPRPDWAIDFAGEAGWTYPQVVDETGSLRAPLSIAGPPLTLLVDADGRIAYQHRGMISSAEQLESLIVEHLGVQ